MISILTRIIVIMIYPIIEQPYRSVLHNYSPRPHFLLATLRLLVQLLNQQARAPPPQKGDIMLLRHFPLL